LGASITQLSDMFVVCDGGGGGETHSELGRLIAWLVLARIGGWPPSHLNSVPNSEARICNYMFGFRDI
jgi:hypothetical protein